MPVICRLFADAKLAEDSSQQFVGGDLAGDLAQVEHAFANILREQVVADVALQPLFHAADAIECLGERLVMAQIGDDYLLIANRGNCGGLYQQILKLLGAKAFLG